MTVKMQSGIIIQEKDTYFSYTLKTCKCILIIFKDNILQIFYLHLNNYI